VDFRYQYTYCLVIRVLLAINILKTSNTIAPGAERKRKKNKTFWSNKVDYQKMGCMVPKTNKNISNTHLVYQFCGDAAIDFTCKNNQYVSVPTGLYMITYK